MKLLYRHTFLAFLSLIFLASCSSTSSNSDIGITSVTVIDYRHIDIVFDSEITSEQEDTFETASDYVLASSTFTGFSNVGYSILSIEVDPDGSSDRTKVRVTLNKCLVPTTYSITYKEVSFEFSSTGNVAFVTKAKGTGDLKSWADAGGAANISAGDAVCQAEAAAAGLSGTFKAWLSDRSSDAKDRIGANTKGWIRTDGHPFATSMENLIYEATQRTTFEANKGPLVPLRYHADGSKADISFPFTATYVNGTKHLDHDATEDCNQWNSTSSNNPITGDSEAGYYHWTDNDVYNTACDEETTLLCFQTDNNDPAVTSADYQSSGKIVFVTSDSGSGDLESGGWGDTYTYTGEGISRGDNICQTLAQASGLDNYDKFKAWLSTTTPSTTNAIARFSYQGPWVLLNGVKIADTAADLIDGSIFAPIDIIENGKRYYDRCDHNYVWTGTDDIGNAVTSGTDLSGDPINNLNCQNWSSVETSPFDYARIGILSRADSGWTSQLTFTDRDWIPCAGSGIPIYCFEDQ